MTAEPYYQDDWVTLWHGDCRDMLQSLPAASVDAVVTDPPYGLGFMGKAWDAGFINGSIDKRRQYAGDPSPKAGVNGGYRSAAAEAGRYDQSLDARRGFGAWCELWATECLRVLKPGGHMLAFGGTRTFHRLACAVEDAGFEIRDSIAWLYGSGFPKSLDVSKAIDKAAGAERVEGGREWSGGQRSSGILGDNHGTQVRTIYDIPATPDAHTWQGWGTALKPAFEPIVVARKPLAGTVAANVLAHGTGALNVDGCRIEAGQDYADKCASVVGLDSNRNGDAYGEWTGVREDSASPLGRWPANVVLDESQADALDLMSGERLSAGRSGSSETAGDLQAEGWGVRKTGEPVGFGDFGGASRFMYVAKADAAERVRINGTAHPTVKPLALMRWLVRLVTPPGGTVLEPFAGSGTTVEACLLEGFKCIAAEREVDYLPLIVQRINRRRDPVKAILASGEEDTLFGGVA